MNFALYLLSIVDRFSDGVGTVYAFCIWIAIILGVVNIILAINSEKLVWSEEEVTRILKILTQRWVFGFFVAAMFFRLVEAMIPGRKDIVEAYAMIEGSKILTAANGEAVAKEVGSKVDKFMDIVAKRYGTDLGLKVEAKPETPKDAGTK